jgi:hypothetical protein
MGRATVPFPQVWIVSVGLASLGGRLHQHSQEPAPGDPTGEIGLPCEVSDV